MIKAYTTRKGKIHVQLHEVEGITACGKPLDRRPAEELTMDPRQATCQMCKSSKRSKSIMKKIEEHQAGGLCGNLDCKVCFP